MHPTFYDFRVMSPSDWEHIVQNARDAGVNIIRIVPSLSHFFNRPDTFEERRVRALDAWIMLMDKYGIIPLITLLDWGYGSHVKGTDFFMDENAIEVQKEFVRFIADRYKDTTVIYDLENEPTMEYEGTNLARRNAWNDWLKDKYGSIENMTAVWGVSPGSHRDFGRIPLLASKNEWTDLITADKLSFIADALKNWADIHRDEILSIDPDSLVTIGLLQPLGSPSIDHVRPVESMDFTTPHLYMAPESFYSYFPGYLKLHDRSVPYGQAFGLGEFGMYLNPWIHTWYPDSIKTLEELALLRQQLYSYVIQVSAALGGTHAITWELVDTMRGLSHDYGMIRADGYSPKGSLTTFRNAAMVVNLLGMKASTPDVFVLVPEYNRLGPSGEKVSRAIVDSVNALVNLGVSVGVIHQRDLSALPDNARIIFAPVPYILTDIEYEFLTGFVESGGYLYVSGDISYNIFRKAEHEDRLEKLFGITAASRMYDGLDFAPRLLRPGNFTLKDEVLLDYYPFSNFTVSPDADVDAVGRTSRGPVAFKNKLGEGYALFVASPIELTVQEQVLQRIYAAILEDARLELSEQEVTYKFDVKGKNGLHGKLFFNEGPDKLNGLSVDECCVKLGVGAGWNSLVMWNEEGIHAVEFSGELSITDERFMASTGQVAVVSLDGQDLRISSELVVVPFEKGTIVVPDEWAEYDISFVNIKDGSFEYIGKPDFTEKDGDVTVTIDNVTSKYLLLITKSGFSEAGKERLLDSVLL